MTDGVTMATLVANSPCVAAERLHAHVAGGAAGRLVGVDGGAATLLALGYVPDIVTGDFDSLPEAARADLAARGAYIISTPDQSATDLDKALEHVLSVLGARRVRVFGATGGRLDHTYSVLSALLKHAGKRPDSDIRLVDDDGETWVVPAGETTLSGPDLPGRTLSLMALGPAHDIWTTGVRWPLSGESLAPGVRDGTLNEIVEKYVTIRVGVGELVVMVHHEAASCASGTPLPSAGEGTGVGAA